MSQLPGQMPNRHSSYEPFAWVFWVRMVQLGLTVVLLAMNAYAASKGIGMWGLNITWWAVFWTLVWVPASVWGVPRIPVNYRPNIIVLVLECFSWFWWLLAFAGLAMISSAYTFAENYGGYKRSTTVSPGSSSTGSSSGTYYTSTGSYGSSSSSTSSYYDDLLKDLQTAITMTKAGTAFAALIWALFVATFVATCIKIHRQRKERLQEIYNANGNPNVTINNIHMHSVPVTNDKQAEVQVTQNVV